MPRREYRASAENSRTGTSKTGRNSKPESPAQKLAPAVNPRSPRYSTPAGGGHAAGVGFAALLAALAQRPLRR